MTLKLNALPVLVRPSFNFIVAENADPEPVEISALFAVDQGHNNLLKLRNQSPTDPQYDPHFTNA